MKFLSVDLGLSRTGIAVSDDLEMMAIPLKTIRQKNQYKLLNEIAELVKVYKIDKIVLGLPKNMDGSEGASAKNARLFSEKLFTATGLEVILQDERVTTVLAHSYLNAADIKKKKKKDVVDTVSAVIILQNYLDFRKNKNL